MKLTIDRVIKTTLVALYSQNIFSEKIYLKGGQALRVKENLLNRFSADIDFSTSNNISDEEVFFEMMETTLKQEFYQNQLYLFDFKFIRRPKIKSSGAPDFWSGWGIEFKLIENEKRNLSKEQLSREALIPEGANSPKINIDISEHEYCNSIEKIKIDSVEVKVYSRVLLLLEKIRAICQQHQDYPHKVIDQRARDYYDIERLWSKVIDQDSPEAFLEECALHIENVFSAKDVDISLLDKIFDQDFIDLQKSGWVSVESTVKGNLQSFEYYNESLMALIRDLKKKINKT